MSSALTHSNTLIIDSHCHFDLVIQALKEPPETLLKKAQSHNINIIIVPGLDPNQWKTVIALAEKHNEIYFAAGLHPWWIDKQVNLNLKDLRVQISTQLNHPKCIAIGECGLDAFIDTDMALQEKILEVHLDLAQQFKKPIILHSRKTDHLLQRLLKKHPLKAGGVLHAFSGHPDIAQQFVKQGLHLGIGGTITYPRARKTIQACEKIGLEHLILETDAPDMPIKGFQGQTNTPEQIVHVAQALADIKQIPLDEVITKTTQNALCLFNLKDHMI
ncbi:MAG: TatD family hydrolase [Pseudomonadota bacterium]|nr:TatD family hydrolase [Pseudomonadota bacterium]